MGEAMKGCIELIPGKFYWTCRNTTPSDTRDVHYFNTDNRLTYEPFYSDFGPLNLSMLYRYCQMMRDKLYGPELKEKKIVHVTGEELRNKTNAAWLAGAFLVCYESFTAEAAWLPFSSLHSSSFLPFRDASQGPCLYDVTIIDCYRGLLAAKKAGFLDFETFDPEEYEKYEKVEHGDFNVISDKFIAFSSPISRKTEICPGVYTFTPADYVQLFRHRGVTAIVRLNKKTYDRSEFLQAGLNHYDLYFLDGSVPPPSIAQRFLDICEAETGTIAVHCKAGLGRTGTLMGLYFMKHYRWTANEAIAWIRIVRPGSIIGPQQYFLKEWEGRMWSAGDQMRRKRAAEPSSSKDKTSINGLEERIGALKVA